MTPMKRKNQWSPVLIVSSIALLMSACGPEQVQSDNQIVETKSDALWLSSGVTLWPGGNINVCFQGFSTAERSAIRSVIEDGWERAAFLDFFGWGSCPTLNSTTSNLLVISTGAPAGFAGQSTFCQNENIASCIGAAGRAPLGDYNRVLFASTTPANRVTLHEFGHVLGFIHESLDSDRGLPCHQTTSGGISEEGEGDLANSIMVAFTSCNGATTLSPWDVLGVRRVYGQKPSGSIVGLGGLCVEIAGANPANGAGIIGFPCKGAQNDTFHRTVGDFTVKTHLGNDITGVNRCLNIAGGVGGSNLISWDCIPSATNEQFHHTGVQWRAMGKMCVAASSSAVGATLSLANCSTSALQKWDFFEADNRIRLSGTSLCVNVPGGSNALGTLPTLATCGASPGPNETFVFGANTGTIRFSDKCLNVFGGTTTVGNPVGLWNGCNDVPTPFNEHFTIAGPIHNFSQCVDMFGGVPFDGVQVGMFPCVAGAPNENWEFFW
jgi:Ricin-type beta-trefoil lectin domain